MSVRDIEMLAQGYFRGPASLREAIDEGKWSWSLERMKSVPEEPEGCSDFERALLNDLESVQKYMQRVIVELPRRASAKPSLSAQANLLTASLLSKLAPFLRNDEGVP